MNCTTTDLGAWGLRATAWLLGCIRCPRLGANLRHHSQYPIQQLGHQMHGYQKNQGRNFRFSSADFCYFGKYRSSELLLSLDGCLLIAMPAPCSPHRRSATLDLAALEELLLKDFLLSKRSG